MLYIRSIRLRVAFQTTRPARRSALPTWSGNGDLVWGHCGVERDVKIKVRGRTEMVKPKMTTPHFLTPAPATVNPILTTLNGWHLIPSSRSGSILGSIPASRSRKRNYCFSSTIRLQNSEHKGFLREAKYVCGQFAELRRRAMLVVNACIQGACQTRPNKDTHQSCLSFAFSTKRHT